MQTKAPAHAGSTHAPSSAALTPTQLTITALYGLGFWFAAALTVRFGAPFGIFGAQASAILFGAAIPICWVAVRFAQYLARLQTGQILPGVAVGLIAATCADGVALTWGRALYGTDPAQIVYGAAWILWGVGWFLLFAYRADAR